MTAERLEGPWHALNGTGLVFANPARAPRQAYAWFVMPDLDVTSFVDDWGAQDARPQGRRFGATFAPMVRLRLDGLHATLER
jgi:levansucrase